MVDLILEREGERAVRVVFQPEDLPIRAHIKPGAAAQIYKAHHIARIGAKRHLHILRGDID